MCCVVVRCASLVVAFCVCMLHGACCVVFVAWYVLALLCVVADACGLLFGCCCLLCVDVRCCGLLVFVVGICCWSLCIVQRLAFCVFVARCLFAVVCCLLFVL